MAAALAHRFAQLEQRLSACEAALMSDPGVALLLRFADIEARIIAVANALKVDLDVGAPIATTETRAVGHPTSGPVASPDFGIPQDADASPTQQRLHKELVEKGFTNFRFVRVPGDYYDQPLEYRQACLSASSIDHLCKSIICQNTRAHPSVVHDDPLNPHNWADWRNSRYYCLIVQYSARLHFEKLKTFVHRLNEGKVGKQYFNLRLAPEDVNDALSGYTHNAVSPIGMAAQLPMIMSHQIAELQPDFFFLGAGEVDLKADQPFKTHDDGLNQLLQRCKWTQVGDILGTNVLDLMEGLNLSLSKVQALQELAARQIAPAPLTAAQLYQASLSSTRVPTGLPTLDRALKRGLPVGAITELVGPSGVGKSQTCLSVVLQVVAPKPWGLQRCVIYVDTESKFSGSRLSEMLKAKFSEPLYGPDGQLVHLPDSAMDTESLITGTLDRVKLYKISEPDQLKHCMASLPGNVLQTGSGLVVIDSIAAFTRTAFDTTGKDSKEAFRSRGELLGLVASQLKSLAEQCRIPVLVTNQVSARFGSAATAHDFQGGGGMLPHGGSGAGGGGDGGHLAAALGTAWAHSVNVRIILERYGNQRRLQLIKSPASGNVAVEYAIRPSGVQEVEGQQVAVQGNVLAAAIQNHIDYRVQEDHQDMGYY